MPGTCEGVTWKLILAHWILGELKVMRVSFLQAKLVVRAIRKKTKEHKTTAYALKVKKGEILVSDALRRQWLFNPLSASL